MKRNNKRSQRALRDDLTARELAQELEDSMSPVSEVENPNPLKTTLRVKQFP